MFQGSDSVKFRTSDFETQAYWVTAMQAARQAQSAALLSTITNRPALSTFGTFTLKNTIRKEIGEMFGSRSTRGNNIPRSDSNQRYMSTGLTESDRRRKPD